MGFPVPSTGSVTEDTDVVGGQLIATGDIDFFLTDDTGAWTPVTNDTSLGFGSSFSMDANGVWLFSVDNDDPGIQALESGDTLDFQYTVSSTGGDSTVTITVFGVDEPPCFTRGTLIDTPQGPRLIETLRAGDEVLTADAGPVTIRWIGSKRVHEVEGVDPEKLRPIEIQPDAFGPGVPSRVLTVSPMHRIVWQGHEAQLLLGESEVLCPAKSLINGHSVRQSDTTDVEYFHILLDAHHVVMAEGCGSETLYPGRQGLYRFGGAEQEEIFALFPELRADPGSYGPSARLIARNFEAQLLSHQRAA